MKGQLKQKLLGERLETSRLNEEKFNVFWGLPVLSSDAISSVAYASEEILWVLIPVIGMAGYLWMPKVAFTIILLLLILTFSYRQIIDAYPGGGGAYMVAKENLSKKCGLVVGASLSVDYTLTVAVSISAGTAAITSAIPSLYPYRVGIALLIIFLVMLGNLRGVKESSKMFSIPTYAFILILIILIITGVIKAASGNIPAISQTPVASEVTFGTGIVTVFLLMRAFSSGCAALTGVEAICDAVPNFKEPARHNAKKAYIFLALFVLITFMGITYLAKIYQAVPNNEITVIAQIATVVFGKGFMFYLIQATTAIILAMAANTAFAGFPTLLSIIAKDGYVPRQFSWRGHRLNFSNGIVFLAAAAALLVIIFKVDTHLLIPLYAIGVFTSFTLAQAGVFMRWLRTKPAHWHYKAAVNGIGAVVSLFAVIIIGSTKFLSGAWIVLVLIPLLVIGMSRIKAHYTIVANQLDIPNDQLDKLVLTPNRKSHVIIPVSSLNAMVIKALRYAQSISPNIEAFHVAVDEAEAEKLKSKWAKLHTNVPLIVKLSPYREVIRPLHEYIKSEEHASRSGDIITILLPQFIVPKWWQMALHNNTSLLVANALLEDRDIVISILPFYIEDKPELHAPQDK